MLDRWFALSANGTDARTEVLAGITTFLAMSYIIFVQPAVLSGAMFGMDTGMNIGAVTAATCLSAALATLLMALLARYPIALAPGMGQNFFFVFSILPAAAATGHAEPWRVALGVIFVSGVLFLLLSVLGVRERLIDLLSPSMKSALGAGIGLFIAFIGLQNAGVVLKDPGTGVALNAHLNSPDMVIFFTALAVSAILLARKARGALLAGMVVALIMAIAGRSLLPTEWLAGTQLADGFRPAATLVSSPPSPAATWMAFDLEAALAPAMLPLVILVLFMDLFDTLGTLVAVTQEAGLLRQGRLPRAGRALFADAFGTVAGAALGTSTVTSYVESAAGVEQGGRTGLVGVVVAILFLVALPLSPLIAMVGSYPPITAPALVLVGALMIRSVRHVEWNDATEAIPAFLTLAGIPFTYSIADGMALGLIAYPLLKVLSGRRHEVDWLAMLLAAMLVAYFAFVRSSLP